MVCYPVLRFMPKIISVVEWQDFSCSCLNIPLLFIYCAMLNQTNFRDIDIVCVANEGH